MFNPYEPATTTRAIAAMRRRTARIARSTHSRVLDMQKPGKVTVYRPEPQVQQQQPVAQGAAQ